MGGAPPQPQTELWRQRPQQIKSRYSQPQHAGHGLLLGGYDAAMARPPRPRRRRGARQAEHA
ncbi:unnamed protein product [Symbiodinium sp. CCMP2592]|nr:unnamed protein product [Symbiodinium sp. CCMP2592]